MSDGVLGLIGVGISVIGTIGIAIYNQRNVRKQNAENEKTQNIIRKQQKEFESQMLVQQQEFQERITKKQIDADLKAKARIRWITDVRNLVSEYISELSDLERILYELIYPVETIQVQYLSENPDNSLINELLDEIKPYLKEIENKRRSITRTSEKILLYFSSNDEHKEIESKLFYAQNLLILLKAFIMKTQEKKLNPTPLDDQMPEQFGDFYMMIVDNIVEVRRVFRTYFKIEWDKAKEGK